MHRRSLIISQVVAACELVPVNVVQGRIYHFGLGELPVVNVRAGDELVEEDTDTGVPGWAEQQRRFEVNVEIWVAGEGDVDRQADDLALELEKQLGALGTTDPPGVTADWWRYAGSAEPEREGELENQVLARVLTYFASYRVDTTNPT